MCVCAYALLGNVGVGMEGGGQRKQDANESALINVCLISYSALSGHGKERRGGERRGSGERLLGGVHEKVQAQPLIHSLC